MNPSLGQTKDPAQMHLHWARGCQRASLTRSILALASSHQRLDHNLLDRDPLLLNCRNGTLDLRSGKLRPHAANDLLTRHLNVAYDPGARCPRWLTFLNEIFDRDQDLIHFLQRALGYSVTGSVNEQVFFLCYGTGANGKSTLTTLMSTLLGSYSAVLPPGLLIARKHDAHPTELANLYRARFTSTSEVKTQARWDEERIKMLTGGDRIKARRMREDFWEFEPTHKIWISVNHKPKTADNTTGFWRRVRMIPFTVTIPEEQRDPNLLEALKRELPGVLTWLVQGAGDWLEHGLGTAEAVQQATEAYRNPQNDLESFLDQSCLKSKELRVQAGVLYQSYTDWCAHQQVRPLRQVEFGLRLKALGWETTKISVNFYLGLGLRDDLGRGGAPDSKEEPT